MCYKKHTGGRYNSVSIHYNVVCMCVHACESCDTCQQQRYIPVQELQAVARIKEKQFHYARHALLNTGHITCICCCTISTQVNEKSFELKEGI